MDFSAYLSRVALWTILIYKTDIKLLSKEFKKRYNAGAAKQWRNIPIYKEP
jgi:hypothetical protein